jgi:hypothetical protein
MRLEERWQKQHKYQWCYWEWNCYAMLELQCVAEWVQASWCVANLNEAQTECQGGIQWMGLVVGYAEENVTDETEFY